MSFLGPESTPLKISLNLFSIFSEIIHDDRD